MDRIDKQKLIHDLQCFQKDELERRREEYKFSQLSKVEAFAWDLELYGQLQQQFGERVVLKGGAAAQLYFPIELQRNSVDIDVITDLSAEEFDRGLEAITKRLCPNGAICKFTEYVPKQPKGGLKLTRYTVEVPSACTDPGIRRADAGTQRLILDVLFGKLPSAQNIDQGTRTFALDLAFAARLITPDALVGDKLLTLAATTVGIPEERANDRCKQLYDLHRLVSLGLLNESLEIQESFKACMEIQRQITGQENVSLADAVIDVERFLGNARLLDLHDPLVLWAALRTFQSNFVGVDARISRDQWAIGIEMIRLLVESLLAQQNGADIDPLDLLKRAHAIKDVIEGGPFDEHDQDARPRHVRSMQEKLLKYCGIKKLRAATIRGRPPIRMFWYLVTPENIGELEELVRR